MNIDTGEIVDINRLREELSEEAFRQELMALESEGFIAVPDELDGAAKRKLSGGIRGKVSLTSGGKLSRFAAKKRAERRQRGRQNRKPK